jgi:predicted RNase H-like HicB family nuclease
LAAHYLGELAASGSNGDGLPSQGAIEKRRQRMKYRVLLQKCDEGYSVSCSDLPGCWSQGDTEQEALENIKDAIREYLAAREDLLRESANSETREVTL